MRHESGDCCGANAAHRFMRSRVLILAAAFSSASSSLERGMPVTFSGASSSLERGMPVLHTPTLPTLPNQPLPMVEITATGQVTRYSSTLTSIRWMFGGIKLAARDVRLLRSSAPVLAPRDGYMIFDFGDLRGILTHDRLALIGADRPALGEALGEEVQRRLVLDKLDGVSDEQQPFEARALECMLEQVYTTVDETLQRLSVLVSSTLGELTNRSSFDLEGRREAGLGRLLPLRISLSALQARSRRISTLLHELLDSDAHVKDMCLTHHRLVPKPTSDEGFAVGESGSAEGEAVDVMAAEAKAAAVLDSQELIETLLDVYDA
jgi:hypothetical protein